MRDNIKVDFAKLIKLGFFAGNDRHRADCF
jgi:hypothetical protein